MSGDPEQEYFADGMVEEIITALSRIRWLFVIARNSSFTYKGQVVDVKQVGRELGVRYVLEGSVRKAGGRVRITAQLIEAATGAHLWADRFDGSLEDVFDLQDKVASSVAGVIEPALQAAETARSTRPPDERSHRLRASICAPMRCSSRRRSRSRRRLRLLEQAIARDPRYGPALAWAAHCCMRLCHGRIEQDPAGGPSKGRRISPGEPCGWPATTRTSWRMPPSRWPYFGEDIGAMMALVDRALMLNPSFARGWHISGMLRNWAGQPDIAIEHAETALRLSPRAGIGSSLLIIGAAHFLSRRFDEAVPKLLLAIQERSDLPAIRIGFSPPATRIWAGSTTHERSSQRLRRNDPVGRAGYPLPAQRRAPRASAVGPYARPGETGWRSVHQLNVAGGEPMASRWAFGSNRLARRERP